MGGRNGIVSGAAIARAQYMGSHAGFHADETGGEEAKKACTSSRRNFFLNRVPRRVCGVGHENALGNVSPTVVISPVIPPRYAQIIVGLWHTDAGSGGHPPSAQQRRAQAYNADVLDKLVESLARTAHRRTHAMGMAQSSRRPSTRGLTRSLKVNLTTPWDVKTAYVGPTADRDQRPIRDGPPDRRSLSEAPDRARSV